MISAYETLKAAQALGIEVTANGDHLHVKAPVGVMTLELQWALKAHKVMILYILALPEPAKPGAEVEQLRRKIGEMVRERVRRTEEKA